MSGRKIAFGLGSNLGVREVMLANARDAIAQMEGITAESLRASRIIKSAAILSAGAPDAWNIPFLNQVVVGYISETAAAHPEALLAAIKAAEIRIGRKDRGHWAPREIDIDILAIEGVTMQSPTLTIPHAHAHLRAFVLEPLVELWPECVLAEGMSAQDAWDGLKQK